PAGDRRPQRPAGTGHRPARGNDERSPATARQRPSHRYKETTMTGTYPRQTLSIDQQLALRMAAARLREEFDGIFGRETIERFLHSSYDQFAANAAIPHFLPLLGERFAQQR